MILDSAHLSFLANAWKVLLLFLIPIGGGIPGGVVLAQKFGFAWQVMILLYFISDIILACIFEPILLFFLRVSERSPKLFHVRKAMAQSMRQSVARFGINPGPFALVMITFGTDPMTGRTVAFMAGHGFLSGWALAILGDMLFFTVLMASTIWLNGILGDGTLTAVIIMVAMIAVPAMVRALRKRWSV